MNLKITLPKIKWNDRDIIVYSHKLQCYYGCYDLLQYPFLFPHRESDWHQGIQMISKRNKEHYCHVNILTNPSETTSVVDLFVKETKGENT